VAEIPGHSTRGLVTSGLLTLALGTAAAFFVRAQSAFLVQEERFRFVLVVTVTLAGIFFIAASARWWMRH